MNLQNASTQEPRYIQLTFYENSYRVYTPIKRSDSSLLLYLWFSWHQFNYLCEKFLSLSAQFRQTIIIVAQNKFELFPDLQHS